MASSFRNYCYGILGNLAELVWPTVEHHAVFITIKSQKSLEGGLKGSVDAILCLLWKELLEAYRRICVVVANASIQPLDLGFLFFKSVTICTKIVF